MRLWSPAARELTGKLGASVAATLSAAFSSQLWAATPMPVGHRSDPQSARGIIAALGEDASVMLAGTVPSGTSTKCPRVLGCVLGAVLDEALVESYGLGRFGANAGDGLLAYFAMDPAAQGARVAPGAGGDWVLDTRRSEQTASLASALFAGWLDLAAVRECPALFVRTRRAITPVLHLLARHGFGFRGRFALDFRGVAQERLVFSRARRAKA